MHASYHRIPIFIGPACPLSGRGKYTRRGFNRSYTLEQETAVSFSPHLTTAWSGRGNGDLRVVSCACERITEIRDKDNCVLCVRWARIDVPGDPPRPSSRKYPSIIRYFIPFPPPTKHFDAYPGLGGMHGSERGAKGGETSLLAYSDLGSPESPGLCGRFLISLFDSFFPFDNLTGCLRCVASLFSDFLGRWLPGSFRYPALRDTDPHCD